MFYGAVGVLSMGGDGGMGQKMSDKSTTKCQWMTGEANPRRAIDKGNRKLHARTQARTHTHARTQAHTFIDFENKIRHVLAFTLMRSTREARLHES